MEDLVGNEMGSPGVVDSRTEERTQHVLDHGFREVSYLYKEWWSLVDGEGINLSTVLTT